MANLSPEALAKIAAALPDTYETNPDQFASDYQALQSASAEAEKLRQLDSWFQNDYQPWFNTYGGDFAEFQKWKADEAKRTAAETAPSRDVDPSPIHYESPDALKETVEYFTTQLDETRRAVEDRFKLVDATIGQRSEELQRLFALQEQAYGLVNEETWREIGALKQQPDWRPSLDIPKLVTYAQQQHIPDLRRAYQSYSQSDREKDLERRAYERGREEAAREAASRSSTTEMGSGTIFKHALPSDRKTGNAGKEEILHMIEQRRAQRRFGT